LNRENSRKILSSRPLSLKMLAFFGHLNGIDALKVSK
jgi:hypothetical protein